jgi:hypothetical protein
MLGEVSATDITRARDAQGFVENREAAREGGEIAGNHLTPFGDFLV